MRRPREKAVQIRRPNLLSYPASRLFSASESSELGLKSDPCLLIGRMGPAGNGWQGWTGVEQRGGVGEEAGTGETFQPRLGPAPLHLTKL